MKFSKQKRLEANIQGLCKLKRLKIVIPNVKKVQYSYFSFTWNMKFEIFKLFHGKMHRLAGYLN